MKKAIVSTLGALASAAILGTGALAAPAAAAPPAPVSHTVQAGGEGPQVNINIDFNDAVRQLSSVMVAAADREALVKNAMYHAFYNIGQSRLNVMVFNLRQEHAPRFQNVKFYSSFTINGVTYGVWIFENGSFDNNGDGGWINWGFMGNYNRNDKHVDFYVP